MHLNAFVGGTSYASFFGGFGNGRMHGQISDSPRPETRNALVFNLCPPEMLAGFIHSQMHARTPR